MKLFRGVATSDELALSKKLKDACMNVLKQYIHENANSDTIHANLWLTVFDVALRIDDKELEALAGKRFENSFDFDSLKTVKLDFSEASKGTGRKVKRPDFMN